MRMVHKDRKGGKKEKFGMASLVHATFITDVYTIALLPMSFAMLSLLVNSQKTI